MSPVNLEEKIFASADGMSHIAGLPDMFYLAYNVHGLETEERARRLAAKLQRSWKKIMPEEKRLIKEDYDIAKILHKYWKNNQ